MHTVGHSLSLSDWPRKFSGSRRDRLTQRLKTRWPMADAPDARHWRRMRIAAGMPYRRVHWHLYRTCDAHAYLATKRRTPLWFFAGSILWISMVRRGIGRAAPPHAPIAHARTLPRTCPASHTPGSQVPTLCSHLTSGHGTHSADHGQVLDSLH